MNIKKVLKLSVSIAACQSAGVLGSFFTRQSVSTWYLGLHKPSFNPPSWVFGPVWITLYTLMGVSLFLVWRKQGSSKSKTAALGFFFIQLVLNVLWSVLFFGMRLPGAAFIEIMTLWLCAAVTLYLFFRLSHAAGVLLIPYLLWLTFAVVLNFSLWRLNI